MISVITATYNSCEQLPILIESLRNQTDKDFEWVIADGGSSDKSLELLRSIADIDLVISSQRDFGIYDALNRAIAMSSGTHYIVAGADDRFYPDAIARFRRAIGDSQPDIVAASVKRGRQLVSVRHGPRWLFGAHSYIAHHSLSSAFRKELHCRFSPYSRHFPIAADALFVIRACKGGASRFQAEFVSGEVGLSGVSAVDWAGSATEFFRVQLMTGCFTPLQILLLIVRLLKGASFAACRSFRSIRRVRRRTELDD